LAKELKSCVPVYRKRLSPGSRNGQRHMWGGIQKAIKPNGGWAQGGGLESVWSPGWDGVPVKCLIQKKKQGRKRGNYKSKSSKRPKRIVTNEKAGALNPKP